MNSKNLPRDRAGDDTEEEREYLKEKNIFEGYQTPVALSISFDHIVSDSRRAEQSYLSSAISSNVRPIDYLRRTARIFHVIAQETTRRKRGSTSKKRTYLKDTRRLSR